MDYLEEAKAAANKLHYRNMVQTVQDKVRNDALFSIAESLAEMLKLAQDWATHEGVYGNEAPYERHTNEEI